MRLLGQDGAAWRIAAPWPCWPATDALASGRVDPGWSEGKGGCRRNDRFCDSRSSIARKRLAGVKNPCPKSTSHNHSVRSCDTSRRLACMGHHHRSSRPARNRLWSITSPSRCRREASPPQPTGRGSTHPSPRLCGDPDARRRDTKVRARIRPPPLTVASCLGLPGIADADV
jgi:hypothetical protein